jgi:hypothetical protein
MDHMNVSIGRGSDVDGEADRRRALVSTVAAKSPGMPTVGPSAGASCELCLRRIAPGTLQYEINIGRTMIVDQNCYSSHLRNIVELRPGSTSEPRSAGQVWMRAPSYMWIAPSSGGTRCDVCGELIAAGDVEYQISVDGGQTTIDRGCYRRVRADQGRTPPASI